jgi:formylglycine-generating enzyme required for sulfatase activity
MPMSAAQERALKPKDSFKECDKCPEMVVVPAGSFTMGSPNSEKYRGKDEGPQHIVTFATPLAVGKFSVTVGQFAAFVDDVGYVVGSTCFGFGANGKWDEQQNRAWNNPGFSQAESHPVVCVSLNDATAYVSWLTRRTHKPYRLLTESEWEYAARGRTEPGTYPRNWFASEGKDTCSYANGLDQTARNNIAYGDRLDVAPCDDHYAYTAPVGSFPPNHFGLYDMAGNSWQWVEDCYSENYNGVPADGSVSISGDCNTRIVRGGSWVDPPWHLRAAWRFHWPPVGRASNVGFRVTRAVSP